MSLTRYCLFQHLTGVDVAANEARDLGGLVADHRAADDPMSGPFEMTGDRLTARVGLGRARVAHGQHEAGDSRRQLRLVLLD